MCNIRFVGVVGPVRIVKNQGTERFVKPMELLNITEDGAVSEPP